MFFEKSIVLIQYFNYPQQRFSISVNYSADFVFFNARSQTAVRLFIDVKHLDGVETEIIILSKFREIQMLCLHTL